MASRGLRKKYIFFPFKAFGRRNFDLCVFLRVGSLPGRHKIKKNTQNKLFCQTINSDELALGMKRWLEVNFLSLKNIFCQI